MAVTLIDFVPSQVIAPQYQVTLDGNIYTLTVVWNLFAQRYYIQLSQLDGTVVLYTALIGSPIGMDIEEIGWKNGTVTVTTADDHRLQIGQVLDVTIAGCVPTGYNGKVQAFVTGRNRLTYPLSSDPGLATLVGSVQQNVDLVGSLFTTTLVYRQPSKRFEVSDG